MSFLINLMVLQELYSKNYEKFLLFFLIDKSIKLLEDKMYKSVSIIDTLSFEKIFYQILNAHYM